MPPRTSTARRFARSSNLVNLRAERLADADKAGAVVTFTRPRGYFGVGRDTMSFDGTSPPPGVPPGVAGRVAVQAETGGRARAGVAAEFNGERIVGRGWPTAGNHVVLLELND